MTEEICNDYEKKSEEQAQLGQMTAARFDAGKNRHDLIPPFVLDELAKVYTYGTVKYDDDNFLKGMPWRKVIGPLLRHLGKWLRGKKIDEESNCHHLAMVIWQCFALMIYEKYSIGQDNRNPYYMDLLNPDEQKIKIDGWKNLANVGKEKEYNAFDFQLSDSNSAFSKKEDEIFTALRMLTISPNIKQSDIQSEINRGKNYKIINMLIDEKYITQTGRGVTINREITDYGRIWYETQLQLRGYASNEEENDV